MKNEYGVTTYYGTCEQIGNRAKEIAIALIAGHEETARGLLEDEIAHLRQSYRDPLQLNWRLGMLAYEIEKAQYQGGNPGLQLRWATQRSMDGELWNIFYLAKWDGRQFHPLAASGPRNIFAIPENPRSRAMS